MIGPGLKDHSTRHSDLTHFFLIVFFLILLSLFQNPNLKNESIFGYGRVFVVQKMGVFGLGLGICFWVFVFDWDLDVDFGFCDMGFGYGVCVSLLDCVTCMFVLCNACVWNLCTNVDIYE